MSAGKDRGQAAMETLVLTALVSLGVAAALAGLSTLVKTWAERAVLFISLPLP